MEDLDRIGAAFERIADSLEELCKLAENAFEKIYPVKRDATDIDLHIPKTPEEKLADLMSASPEEIEEYVGPRERMFTKSPQEPSPKPRRIKKKVSAKKAQGK